MVHNVANLLPNHIYQCFSMKLRFCFDDATVLIILWYNSCLHIGSLRKFWICWDFCFHSASNCMVLCTILEVTLIKIRLETKTMIKIVAICLVFRCDPSVFNNGARGHSRVVSRTRPHGISNHLSLIPSAHRRSFAVKPENRRKIQKGFLVAQSSRWQHDS